ncbi:swi snf complex protein [Pelomyxa schiedti]|nr:swi snf complex protein [Pelomyxa schiedti]
MNPYAAPGSVVPESELALQPLRSFTKPKWYKPLSADECEKRAFPDLFLAPQNSLSRYVKIRELILTWYKYTQQITYTNCRRSLVSKGITEDACLILRIYNFLVHHHFFEIASASPSSANNDSSLRDAVTTAARVPSSDSSNMNTGSNLDLHNTMPIKPKLSQRLCEKCGADCSKLTKNGSMLCDDCVALGADGTDLKNSLPENLMADATTSNTPHSEPPWTEEETFRLLEGLEIYNMDWDKIAKYVQTRTKHQCVEHLIQMPIEDPYLEDNISVNTNKGTVPGTFASSPNPVMTLVSFLAATVSPAVAAAAATAARNAILAENSRTDTELPSTPSDSLDSISHEECQTASAAALACAAEKASELVKSEDRKIQSCVMEVIEEQMHRLELKLNHFLELESNLESEWMKLQQLQKQLQQQIIYQQQITHQRIDMSRQAPQLHQMQSPANYQSFPQGIPSQPVNHPHQPTPTLHQQVMPTQATQFPTTLGQPMFQQLAIQQAQQQILSPQALPTLQPGQQIPQQRLDI